MKKTIAKSLRTTALVLTLATLLGMIFIVGTAQANAAEADKMVSLYSSSVYFSKYGGTTYEVFVQTKGSANDQQVTIHYNYMNDMDWQDTNAVFYANLNDGSKIWRATFSSFNTKYAIKYVADGVTYWDNNNGSDYNGSEAIGSAAITSERLGYQYNTYAGYRVNAILKNLAYQKNVFVRYTTDGWKTSKDVQMSYSATNSNGTETWTAQLDVADTSSQGNFEYAICYQVNGTEYWANNFGANYNGTYYIYR